MCDAVRTIAVRMAGWLLHDGDEDPAVQGLLLRTLLDDRGTAILCLFWTQFCWVLIVTATGSPWAVTVLVVDATIFGIRWRQRSVFADAPVEALRAAAPGFAAAIVGSALVLSGAVVWLIQVGSTHTLVLGSVVAPGLASFYASLYGGFPRLAILTFGLLDAALTFGLLLYPDAAVALLGPAMPFGGILYYFLITRTRRSLVGSMRAQHENWVRSMHDVLTGLGNRGMLDATLAEACRLATGFKVVIVDLDGFKPVNDRYGHAAGDHVLRRTAQRLRAVMRREDTICRTGGDEFIVVLPMADEATVRMASTRLLTTLAAPIELADGTQVRIGASVGTASFPESGHDPVTLLTSADIALYEAKRGGKGRAVTA